MRILLTIALMAMLGPSARAAQIPNSDFRIGLWTVSAFTDDTSGNFSHCVADVPYQSGISLAFSISHSGSSWRMGLYNPSWKLPIGAQYSIAYTIDGRVPAKDEALVATPQLILWELPPTAALFQLFRTGRLLTVGAAGGTFNFDLTNSSKALSMALGCASYYRNRPAQHVDSNNPFASSVRVPDATKAEATTVLANLLGAAEIRGFRLLSEIPPYLGFVHAAYEAPGIVGGLRIATATTVPDVAAGIVANDQKSCAGNYASTRERAEKGVVSVWSICKLNDGSGLGIMYIMTPRNAGGVYVFTAAQFVPVDSATPPQTIHDTGQGIFEATVRTLR